MIAFVLCKLVAGLEQKAIQQIKSVRGVKDVYMTFGGWDAILVARRPILGASRQDVERDLMALAAKAGMIGKGP